MAESIVQVNSGSGPKLHSFNRTIGANSIEDEVVLLGENYLATYSAVIDTNFVTINSHTQLMAGASLKVRIRKIDIYQLAVATTALYVGVSVIRLTTAGTGGTAVTPVAFDPADAASGATFMGLPTAKGTEGAVLWTGAGYFMQTVGASTPEQEPIISFDFDRPRSKPIIIAAGTANGICIKNTVALAAASIRIDVLFDESNF